MHHVAYRVADIRASLREAAAAGAELIDAEPRTGLFGLQVAFIHPESVAGVLVELACRIQWRRRRWQMTCRGSSLGSTAG